MDSSENCYATTPLKRESNSVITGQQIYYKTRNTYKTPVQRRYDSPKEVNLAKTRSYGSSIIERMPIYSPPPKNVNFVKNPFEHARLLKEKLSQPICSPSLFKAISTPTKSDEFTWSIDDISILRPADIDENPSQDFNSWFSPITESEAQKAINRFFSSQVVGMESPIVSDLKKKKEESVEKPLTLDTWTQTDMSLPPILPPDLEAILSRYCIFSSSPKDLNDSLFNSSSSRKKLVFRNCSFFSPKRKSEMDSNVSTPVTSRSLSPDISPVNKSSPMDVSMRSRSAIILNLSQDVEMNEKENIPSKDWNCQGSSTPRALIQSCDSAFSSM